MVFLSIDYIFWLTYDLAIFKYCSLPIKKFWVYEDVKFGQLRLKYSFNYNLTSQLKDVYFLYAV